MQTNYRLLSSIDKQITRLGEIYLQVAGHQLHQEFIKDLPLSWQSYTKELAKSISYRQFEKSNFLKEFEDKLLESKKKNDIETYKQYLRMLRASYNELRSIIVEISKEEMEQTIRNRQDNKPE